jgi:hypothetical protein
MILAISLHPVCRASISRINGKQQQEKKQTLAISQCVLGEGVACFVLFLGEQP